MRLLFLIFLILIKSSVSDYVLQPIAGIEEQIDAVEFNSDGEAYVATSTDATRHLYKLNPAKEILWATNTTDFVQKIVITNLFDVYVQFRTERIDYYISILREDTLTFEKIDDIYDNSIFIHEDNNVIYNGIDGIKYLRPNSVTPILVKNLEGNFFIEDVNYAVDSQGNIYLGVLDFDYSTPSFAVVAKESLHQQEVPEAIHYELDPGYFVDTFIVDENDDLWVLTSDFFTTSQIKKFRNGTFIDVLFDGIYENHRGLAAKDRVYVVSTSFNYETAPTYFLTLDGAIHPIGDLDQVPSDTFFTLDIVADKDGNFYFGAYFPFLNGPLALVRPNETSATWISFPRLINIESMILDENDDLWVVTKDNGVYYLKKGETTAVKVLAHGGVDKDLGGGINVNKITNEVFVFGNSRLYLVTNL